jgi:hypothetical protein
VTEGTSEQVRGSGAISRRNDAWLAWSLWALSLFLTALGILLLSLNLSHPNVHTYDYWLQSSATGVVFSTLGAFVASRRPEHPVGWLFCAIGFLAGADLFCAQYATYALLAQPGALPAGEAAAWVRSWFGVVGGGLGVFLLLLFPDGRLPSARWKYLVWLNVAVIFLGVFWVAFAPGPLDGLGPIRNPLGIDSLEIAGARSPFDVFEVPWFVIVVVATTSVFVRLHGAGLEERQQIKWFAYAAVVLTSAILLRVLTFSVPTPASVNSTVEGLIALGLLSVAAATAIAILKYRLYEIDIIINRTLVYGSLTAMLVVLYFGGIVVLQGVFVLHTGQQSTIAVVASTLAIAALFSPLRRRIQGIVDRRFYRKKYDARKTLEAFSAQLRDETDLDALSGDLVGVVRETMQPAHVSLWLRPDTTSKGQQTD